MTSAKSGEEMGGDTLRIKTRTTPHSTSRRMGLNNEVDLYIKVRAGSESGEGDDEKVAREWMRAPKLQRDAQRKL